MALTQITADSIADAAITQQKINPSVQLGGGGPKITAVEVTNSSYTELDDTAVALDGGYIKITGSGFVSGASVLVDNTSATSVQFISSTVIRAELPAKAAGSYVVYLVNPDGSVAIGVNGVTYSGLPNWTTSSVLPDNPSGTAISIQLAAESATSYALAAGSTLPSGLSLSSSGLLSGNLPGIQSNTLYSFSVIATDAEFQESSRTFSLTITPPTQPGQVAFTTPGTYSWTVPEGIVNISAVCIGGGSDSNPYNVDARIGGGGGALRYINNLPVTPGETLTIKAGFRVQKGSGAEDQTTITVGNSYIKRSNNTLIEAQNGVHAGGGTVAMGSGGSAIGAGPYGGTIGGGNGGQGGWTGTRGNGGGGAGGYSGDGGAGGSTSYNSGYGYDGTGGGAGGGGAAANLTGGYSQGGGGGGVGLLGQGTSGTGGLVAPGGGTTGNQGRGGSGGSGGADGLQGYSGGLYGGGGGGRDNSGDIYFSEGASGAVRIIWGPGRAFPSTNTGDL